MDHKTSKSTDIIALLLDFLYNSSSMLDSVMSRQRISFTSNAWLPVNTPSPLPLTCPPIVVMTVTIQGLWEMLEWRV